MREGIEGGDVSSKIWTDRYGDSGDRLQKDIQMRRQAEKRRLNS
jgi:hypothetical protein